VLYCSISEQWREIHCSLGRKPSPTMVGPGPA
jgi:hypothetical protein